MKVTVWADGEIKVLEAEQTFVAVGFLSNSKGPGLEETGVKISDRGFFEIDEKMATRKGRGGVCW